ncbi:hydroxylysine kinase /5-phosphonooxy-L-lysine phospho-lyase [Actinomadura pelletieri DSM 43383]|uniref:Hydroxylysine kinase /5-phosphonooxy-L-lysine phospho-lyase n=1 Tax=Actinomadura pelletieri DSM 43383 TaxID=1120940 RepID=A0A495QTT5_9ACTN|nr:aminotransferase class III-fold pyridoxal phosphate-dependent enzyme [Actinomadura pelletieri]RKS76936.1 hydroxylysine kinase /5-phosphonooxy-L-lysine phospho-lyase [Actinomadura pelletieri DSM 43383]
MAVQTERKGVDERFERITAGVPELSDERLRDVLRDRYGLEAVSLRRLAGETDQNTHVVDGSGTEYVLKVSDPADLPAIEFQTALLAHLAERDPGLVVPRAVADVSGSPVTSVRDGERELPVRLLTWVPGAPLAEVGSRSAELLADVGAAAGRLAAATATFSHPAPPAPHYWEFPHAGTVLEASLGYVTDPALRDAATTIRDRYAPLLAERLPELPTAVVHHDLNAFNVLVHREGGRRRVSGVIDFGDALPTARIADLAVLASSVMRGAARPLTVAATLAAAYHAAHPLTEAELDLLFPLVAVRAATVAVTAARLDAERRHGDPRHRSAAAADLVRALAPIPAEVGRAAVRHACGLPAHPAAPAVTAWLAANTASAVPPVDGPLAPVDLGASSEIFDDVDPREPGALRAAATAAVIGRRPGVAVGRYGEPRFLEPRRRRGAASADEPDNVHLGLDLFAGAGTPVRAPLPGLVEAANIAGVDLALLHEPAEGVRFRTLYTGLSGAPAEGEKVAAGATIGRIAPSGGLPPHVRVQVAVTSLDGWTAVPAAATDSEQALWQGLLPDPTPLLGAQNAVTAWTPVIGRSLQGRRAHLPDSHPMYFEQPIAMARARDTRFYDEQGRSYLDALNNVTLVGHSHPRLVDVAARQLGRLNTNTRFVYDSLTEYAERLTATLPDGLDVVYFVNSGSEANDLALRMSRYLTKRDDVVIIDDAYHGYTSVVSDVSPSRYKHYGKPDTTHPTPVPDRYRGAYGYDDPDAGAKYARHVIDEFDRLAAAGRPPAAYLFEALLAGGGQVVLPPGYLAPIFAAAAERGVLTIADEVQVGFGRLGEAFWGFQTQGPDVVPDFVTMGKAMGNGFPIAALVTTREISRAFDPTGRFFSTYGGNPVACAVGLELLNIVDDEGLQHNALVVGQYLRDRLAGLGERHELVGDVRGQGFYSGVEFVLDRDTKEPASDETLIICERLKDQGVLVYPTGPYWNILKLKPPLTFTRADADDFTDTLDDILTTGW